MVDKSRKYQLLISDDSDELIWRLNERLSGLENLEMLEPASDGFQAFTIIKQSKPDVLILDIQMPGLNGLELLKLVKTLDIYSEEVSSKSLKIILSLHCTDELEQACRDAGADAVFDKQSGIESLVNKIKTYLNGE